VPALAGLAAGEAAVIAARAANKPARTSRLLSVISVDGGFIVDSMLLLNCLFAGVV
jgi:hypothetical protein